MYNTLYLDEIKKYNQEIDYSFLDSKTICLSGATGLIGSFLIDSILINPFQKTKIVALVRNIEKARKRFYYFSNDSRLIFIHQDLLKEIDIVDDVDFVLHLASLTDPYNYSHYPIEVMNTNYIGTKNLLDLAFKKKAKFLLSSTCEIYGKNECMELKENNYGYVDILDPRSCYNESKKASETLCVCYHKEKNVDVVVARLSRVYGPTMKLEDTKALSQFINKAINNDDIVLKSKGEQRFNYTYVGDVVHAIAILLKNSHISSAYNFTNEELIPLKDIASYLATFNGKKVVFNLPSEEERAGYSKSLVSSLSCELFQKEFKYKAKVNLFDGLKLTLNILQEKLNKKD